MTACYLKRALAVLSATLFLLSSVHAQNATISLREALKKVTKIYGTQFVFDPELLNGKTTSFNPKEKPRKELEDVLKEILYPNNLVFLYVKPNYYTITSKDRVGVVNNQINESVKADNALINPNTEGQNKQISVSGTVFDNKNAPIPRVSVNEKGTSNTTVTDENGNFKITVANSQS